MRLQESGSLSLRLVFALALAVAWGCGGGGGVTPPVSEATFTPENTYFRNDRVKQVVGVKLQLKGAFGFAKPGMSADGEILVAGNEWPQQKRSRK